MAHPSDGMVELAARLDRRVRVTPACCSIAVGDEVMAMDDADAGLEIDLAEIVRQERERREAQKRQAVFGRVKVVGGEGRSGCCGA